MPSSQRLPRLVLRIALCLVLGCMYLPCAIYAQTAPTQTELDTALARVNSGDVVSARDVVVLANAGAVQAIPALEKQFGRATDVDTKTSIASGLVKLGDKNDTYWNYLLEQATLAVDSNVPDVTFSYSQAKMVMGGTPELKGWAEAHNLSMEKAVEDAIYDFPGKLLELGVAGDRRGIPLLRRALLGHNYLMVSWAAKGLALIHDKESIPLIIAACQRAPAGYDALVAGALVYFDDPQAQSAVDIFMPKEMAKMARDGRAQGMGVFGW
jgi:hypothetical protein